MPAPTPVTCSPEDDSHWLTAFNSAAEGANVGGIRKGKLIDVNTRPSRGGYTVGDQRRLEPAQLTVIASRHSPKPRRPAIVSLAIASVLALTVTGIVANSVRVIHQPNKREFCFAEWCIAPTSYQQTGGASEVVVHVRSDAKAASQRPDRPQAWLVEQSGTKTGGRQPNLERLLGPGESYDSTLSFPVTPSACPWLAIGEGAWPSFLGLGYAPSPFTETVDWPLCGNT